MHISKVCVVYARLMHLWYRLDISLQSKDRVHCAAAPYGGETWSLCAEDVQRFEVRGYRCLSSVTINWWNGRVDNMKLRSLVSSTGSENISPQRFKLCKLRWLGRLLCTANTYHTVPHFPPISRRGNVK